MAVASPVFAAPNLKGDELDYEMEATKEKSTFRNYVDSSAQDRVERTYREQHTYQTYDYVLSKQRQYYGCNSGLEMSIWEAAEMLNHIVDESDPDVDTPQINHLLQTAEAIRRAYPGEEWDWFHLAGFIHDLGKLLLHPKFGEPQWAVVGDTFPVGCRFDETNVFYESFKFNPDAHDSRYNTPNGVYESGCGLDKVAFAFGHDDYMYNVCKVNNCKLPLEALYMIRYHSFYPHHREGAYKNLSNKQDEEMMKWVIEFNKFDLYSKEDIPVDVEKLRPYYEKIALKYFGPKVKF